ncbi:unnamed protein product [Cylicostephanus goldi]|uniref:Uncharacterized protein n=1 Tax=Cylicostephanus goldi TaxID=71465 RepID=A0A3P6UE79_CYLGO|nr:unnamed protein product [Cylicostephanus goldi]
MEEAIRDTAELRLKCQSLLDDRERVESELDSELNIVNQRCVHLRTHCDRLSNELTKLRKECKVAECRLSSLIEENALLRGKNVGGSAEELDTNQIQKILEDQSHLIAALKEEGKLLLQQLAAERKENKSKVKTLKKENRELEDRLQKLLTL